ncbi:MAG: cheB2 [Myxococcales bacterium]|nr:cheB2 [Myxococcales bacterium]
MGHDLIVIGSSAGGIEALCALTAELPADLAAAICIVQHVSPTHDSQLPRILSAAGPLPAAFADNDTAITPGHIYVARRDRHLIVADGKLKVMMGPKENNFRPAVDPLFRSAASSYGARVVGVILSGALDCGTAGLLAVKRCGGVALVQDPDEAIMGDMPRSAIENVPVDAVLPLVALAARLVELSREPVRARMHSVPRHILEEVKLDGLAPDVDSIAPIGVPAGLTCPNCAGPMYDVPDGAQLRFRCRVGHAFGGKSLSAEQLNVTEGAFWAALRALEEQAALARRLATRARELGQTRSVRMFEERASSAEHQARIVREELLKSLTPSDDAETVANGTAALPVSVKR